MTNIKNIKYWEMREARNMYKDMQLAEDCAKELSVIYSKAAIYTAKQIEGIFNRFASKHHLTRDEAINLLSEADSRNFEKLLEAYKNKTGAQKREALAELEAPAYKNRMKRLDDIDKSINRLINAVASKERDAIDKTMRKVYESSYHHAVYETARMSGLDLQTGPIDEGALETILKKKWSGQNYSERVWNNTQKVADALKEELMIGALTGKTEKEMTDSINEQFLSGRNNARRLVRTESSYIHNEAHFQAYRDYGIEEYRFVATLDLRTSQICREKDGSVYRVNDKKIGVNAPPMHPWCRSTTIMNLDDETMHNLERFARDPVTGERMKVPADETYKEWYQRMVEKHGTEASNVWTKERLVSSGREIKEMDKMGRKTTFDLNSNEEKRHFIVYKNDKYKNIYCQTNTRNAQKMSEFINEKVNIEDRYGELDHIIIVKSNSLRAIAGYDHVNNDLYISEELIDSKLFKSLVSSEYFPSKNVEDILNHELGGHKKHWDAIKRYQELYNLSIDRAKESLEENLRKYVINQQSSDTIYLKRFVSKNASDNFDNNKQLNESIADVFVLYSQNKMKDENLTKLVLEVLNYDD